MALICQSLGPVTAVNTRDHPLCCHYAFIWPQGQAVAGERHHGYLAAICPGAAEHVASLRTEH